MTKITSFRRLLSCFSSSSSTTAAATSSPFITPKKRLSTSLRDDLPDDRSAAAAASTPQNEEDGDQSPAQLPAAPPRPSKTMVVGTIFGSRRGGGHVFFCVQHDRLSTKPLLLLELSVPTHHLVREMRFGLVRIALESDRPEFRPLPLRSVPVWTMTINGRRAGFARRRRPTEGHHLVLEAMKSTTVGAGVIPSRVASEEVMYMRANYEHVVGCADVESFHLVSPELASGGSGQELSVFLISCWLNMLEGKAVVRETDMPGMIQSHVTELAYKALDLHEVSDCQSIAHFIKQCVDEAYGPAWHCVVGRDFGCCITHLTGSFIFFRVEMLEFLIFKDGNDFNQSKEEAIGVAQKPTELIKS